MYQPSSKQYDATESEQMSSQETDNRSAFQQPQMIVNLDSSRYSDESDDLMGDFVSQNTTPVRSQFGRNLTNSPHSRRPAISKRKMINCC